MSSNKGTNNYREKGQTVTTPFERDDDTVDKVLKVSAWGEWPGVATEKTMRRFGVRVRYSETDGKLCAIYVPGYDSDCKKIITYQKKDLTKDKNDKYHFLNCGTMSIKNPMFFQAQANPNANHVYICEGPKDALALYQTIYDQTKEEWRELIPPIVSVTMGAPNAKMNILHNEKFIKQYVGTYQFKGETKKKGPILCFDNDCSSPFEKVIKGHEATEETAAALSSYDVKILKHPDDINDIHDYVRLGRKKELYNKAIFGTIEYRPERIVSLYDKFKPGELKIPIEKGVYLPSYPKLMELMIGDRRGELTLFLAPSNAGKCFSKGTKVIMADTSIKSVEDIKVGDKVLGEDGKERTVLSLHKGYDVLYRINQTKMGSYNVNSRHILCLKAATDIKSMNLNKGDICNIPIKKFLQLSKWKQNSLVGWHPDCVEFSSDRVYEPWAVGNWLADGSVNTSILTVNVEDTEIIEEWLNISNRNNYEMCIYNYFKGLGRRISIKNGFLNKLREIGILDNKRVPFEYRISNINDRIELLSGILDGDGYLTNNGYEIAFKSKDLCDDIAFIARSLGLNVTVRDKFSKCQNFNGRYYKRMFIYGNTDILNLRLTRKKATKRKTLRNPYTNRIKVEDIGYGEYFGFETDGNHLFLLENFTVVHNSTISADMVYEYMVMEGYCGGVFLEEDLKKTFQRFVARKMEMNLRNFRLGLCPIDDEKYNMAEEWVADPKNFLAVENEGKIKISELESLSKLMVRKYNRKKIVIDHLMLTEADTDKSKSEREQLDRAMETLAALCKNEKCSILLICHVNRGATSDRKRDISEPMWQRTFKEDARGSSSIECLSYNVICLDVEVLPSKRRGRVRLCLDKNREGGDTGLADVLIMDYKSGLMINAEDYVYDKEKGIMVPPEQLNTGY